MKTTSNDISKDRESGITATSILKERGIDSNAQTCIQPVSISRACQVLQIIFFCIQPNRWELD